MWMIRFIQYPRNSVENLNRALYVKLLKIQCLSDRKFIPFPAWGREDENFRKSHGMKIYKKFITLFLIFIFCISCGFLSLIERNYFVLLIKIPEDILNQEFLQTRALCKFSTEFLGCWKNRIVHTSVTYVS